MVVGDCYCDVRMFGIVVDGVGDYVIVEIVDSFEMVHLIPSCTELLKKNYFWCRLLVLILP